MATLGFTRGWDDEQQLLSDDEVVYTSLASGGSGASVNNDEEEPEGVVAKDGAIFEVPLEVRRERVGQWRMAALASWQLAFSAIMAFVMPILLPLQTIGIVGKADKGTALGFGLSVATVVATVVSLASGQASDHISTCLGKRTPFVILGSVGMALSLVAMSWYGDLGLTGAGVYVVYAVLLVVMRTFASVSETAFQPLLPDLVPKEQMGTVSGWWAMASMLGNVFGAAGMSFIMDKTGPVVITLGLSSALVLGTGIAILANREKSNHSVRTPTTPDKNNNQECARVPALRFLARYSKPFMISSNFRWIFATRFLTQLGWGFVNSFAFFFVSDVAPKPYRLFNFEFTNSNDAVGVFLGSVLLSAVLSGYVGGALGDRLGRKRMVYVSSALQSLACLGFTLFSIWPQQFIYVVLCSILMGTGLGAYLAVDFALATECLPSEESRGTDLAVWGLTSTLPSAIAGPLGGLMLDNGQRVGQAVSLPNLGYVGLFGCCAFLLAVSGFFVRYITVGNPTAKRKQGGIDFELLELEELEDEPVVAAAGEDRESLMHISEGEIN